MAAQPRGVHSSCCLCACSYCLCAHPGCPATGSYRNIAGAYSCRFEELNMDLFRKCMEPVEKCLRDAKMDKSSVRPLSKLC